MRIAILTTDNRENDRRYDLTAPYFGTAPTGLLAGFAMMEGGELRVSGYESRVEQSKIQNLESSIPPAAQAEIHVIACTQIPMASPAKLAPNIHFHSLHVPKWGWLKTGYSGCILAIRKKLREIQPDIVHAQGTERECAMAAVFSPCPRVLTIHGNLRLIRSVLKPKPWSALALQSLLEGYAVPKFDGVVCITNYTREAIQHETPKTWLIPNAVDPDFLALGDEREDEERAAAGVDGRWKMGDVGSAAAGEGGRSEIEDVESESLSAISNIPSSLPAIPPSSPAPIIQNPKSKIQNSNKPPVVLVVANVDARKNQNAFIQALDGLASRVPFQLKFFGRNGGGEYGAEFERLVAAREWCEFGGMISRAELREEFRQASIVALPTNEDNCPMVVLEAQAAGLPVMASNVGGVPDLVENGVTGLLTDPTSPESMAKAIERLLAEPELVATLVSNGRRQAREKFHPQVIAQRHLEVYREILHAA